MATLDEAHTLENSIAELKERSPANKLTSETATTSTNDRRMNLWLNEATDLVNIVVSPESYLSKQAATLRDKLPAAVYSNDLVEEAEDLLDATLRYSRLKARDAISDDFRRAVEIAVKDGYFESWPFRALMAAFALTIALLFGGTIYSTWQVAGIQKQTEDAQRSIRDKSNDFEKQLSDAARDIEDKRTHLEQTIRNAVSGKDSQIDAITQQATQDAQKLIVSTKELLNQTQTKVVSAMNDDLHAQLQGAITKTNEQLAHDAKNIRDEWDKTDQNVNKKFTDASDQIKAAKEAAIAALSSRGTEVDEKKRAALSTIDTAKTVTDNDLSKIRAEMEGKRDESLRAFAKLTDDFSNTTSDAQKKMAAEIEKLPDNYKRVANVLNAIDSALNKYKLNIAGVVGRLEGDQPRSALSLAVDVLGLSFWLVVASLILSVLAIAIVVIFLILQRKRVKNANSPASA